ncbi:EthD domain-containing protein [Roseofilum sp. BLCC_M154]|uniref:EthD domain-containing protein n=1 Tax=Roseofilum acuticapitatum BLCC-M154 TaxID=3022444 RepID=A0ABT7AM03_9CYAN|nr:EthD domain-containing protein [Roseofilum acuticapitatum]MDJ1167934.1 EthD domain-containing protein [Roseofilum acuticapitatum BLCC-M154]
MPNYADRDKEATISLYFMTWKRHHVDLETFDSYWGNVHGPIGARLSALYQYWQIRTCKNYGDIWNPIEGVTTTSMPEENFDAIGELTFKSQEEIPTYIKLGMEYLGDDDPNFLRRNIAYVTTPITYYDEIENPAPTWETEYDKFHIMIRKNDGVNLPDFHEWMQVTFAPQLAKSASVIKLRLNLMLEADKTRTDGNGVSYSQDPAMDVQAAMEIGFRNRLALRTYLASDEYKSLTTEMKKYVKSFQPYPERSKSTFVYNGTPTLAGQRGLSGALAIEKLGAMNQVRENITQLMLGQG